MARLKENKPTADVLMNSMRAMGLLSKTKAEYDNEMSRGSASLPQLADSFTMGTLPYMFKDNKNPNQQGVLRKRMREYLQTIVLENVLKNILIILILIRSKYLTIIRMITIL